MVSAVVLAQRIGNGPIKGHRLTFSLCQGEAHGI